MKIYLLILLAFLVQFALSAEESDFNPENIISSQILKFHQDLIELKKDYPQLSDIEKAKIKNLSYSYEKGFLKDSKKDGAEFEKDGCDILINIIYPADAPDRNQLKGSPYLRLKNGKYLKFYILVRAEKTNSGKEFTEKIQNIAYGRIKSMLESLGNKPEDFKMQINQK